MEPEEAKHSSLLLQCKLLACFVSLILAVAFSFGIYFVATSPNRQECLICPSVDIESIILPSFFIYSSWTLCTTCITWGLYVRRRFFSSISPECLLPRMFRVSLPLSVAVSFGYTFYFATSDLGRDFVDEDICYTVPVFASAIPREGTSLAEAVIFLILDGFTNATIHYFCGAINVALYFKHSRRETWNPLPPLVFITAESLLIIAIHELFEPVYCTENIFLSCLWMTLLFGFLHVAFFCRKPINFNE